MVYTIIDGVYYDRYTGISAIIITDDNIYSLNVVFYCNKKENIYSIFQMRLDTGKSEAYETLDYFNRDDSKYRDQFLYVDYHDEDFDNMEEYSCYEVIFGEILASRGESTEVTLEEAEALVSENITEEQLIEKLGTPRASVVIGFSYDYYTMSSESDSYIMFEADEDGIIDYCKSVSKKYTAWVDVK
jgi:CRISPR/Cas system-associated protein Cas5 (RAMP superfamily)